MIPGLGGRNSLPFAIPARFLLTGALAFCLAWSALLFNPNLLLGSVREPAVLALVHTLTLGFATMILVGAMHQLVPVLLITNLHAPRWGNVTYGFLLAGALCVIFGFLAGYQLWLILLGGGLELLGLLLFNLNLYLTNKTATQKGAVSHAVLAAAGYLSFTVLLGLLNAAARASPALGRLLGDITPLHLSVGLFAAFMLAIAGAGHKLLGMFTLSHHAKAWPLTALIYLIHAAVALLLLDALLHAGLWRAAGIFFAAAGGLYSYDTYALLKGRMRRRLETPLRGYLGGSLFLLLSLCLALAGAWSAAVFSVLAGFIPLAIAGMLVKVGSFLAWQHRYAAQVGKTAIPMVRDMTVVQLSALSQWGIGLGAFTITCCLLWPSQFLATLGSALATLGAWSLLLHLLWISFGKHPAKPKAPSAHLKGHTP